ncbi:MAG TPA: GNAT family N-acetyltransferase [Ktedonobacterales bacterium]|nr:GNAT family N-acetyltransferase [Ktedonobacterales bacterium]
MTGAPEGERIACEELTDEIIARYAAEGFTLTFAEDVMRRDLNDLSGLPDAPLPAGVTLSAWMPETVPAFFAAYAAAFADRPGFPGWSEERWVEWTAGDADFRPNLSWVAVAGAEPVGFITCAEDTTAPTPSGFIIQTGTRPDWRGRGLATALVTRALGACREAGFAAVVLDVNVNNPTARRLYDCLGFVVTRRRGSFQRGG